MTDLEALVIAANVFADEYSVPAGPGRPALTRDAELVALAVGISSDRQYLGLVERVLPDWFPHLPDQSQYNRRLRALVELISLAQQQLARWLEGAAFVSLTAPSLRSQAIPAASSDPSSPASPATATRSRTTASSGAYDSCC